MVYAENKSIYLILYILKIVKPNIFAFQWFWMIHTAQDTSIYEHFGAHSQCAQTSNTFFYLLPGMENSAGGIWLVSIPRRHRRSRRCAPLKA